MKPIRVAWMYHDIMDLYGDRGNILSLQKRAQDYGLPFELETVGMNQKTDLSSFDIVFLGGGADKEQMTIMPDLLGRKEDILKALDAGTFFLLICGGYQFFGQYYLDAKGNRIDGLGLFDYYTVPSKDHKRCIGDIIVEADLDGEKLKLIGFENHGGQTMNVDKPLGKVLHGFGNHFDGEQEGFYNGQVLATYMHGPLLPKNSRLTDFILKKVIQKRHPEMQMPEKIKEPPFEKEARNVLLERYKISN